MAEEIFDIYVLVKETSAIIHASEAEWCKVRTSVPGREWLYCFEESKGQPFPDTDYEDPVLHIERLDGRLQLSIYRYSGQYHVDVFVFGRPVWQDVGGAERSHVGDSSMVELPYPPPVFPPLPPAVVPPGVPEVVPEFPPEVVPEVVVEVEPPLPIDWTPVTELLEKLHEKMSDIKDEIRPLAIKANTYYVRQIDLSTARLTFKEFTTGGFAMTILTCTGNMEIKLGDVTTDGIPIAPLSYPSTVVIDRMDFDRFYVKNAAQPGLNAAIIVWRRE